MTATKYNNSVLSLLYLTVNMPVKDAIGYVMTHSNMDEIRIATCIALLSHADMHSGVLDEEIAMLRNPDEPNRLKLDYLMEFL